MNSTVRVCCNNYTIYCGNILMCCLHTLTHGIIIVHMEDYVVNIELSCDADHVINTIVLTIYR